MSKISNYALWFDIRINAEQKISTALKNIYEQFTDIFEIQPNIKYDFLDMFLKISDNFYLIRVEEHYSPGDLAAVIKHQHLDEDDQVMAILISEDYYLPHHGMTSISRNELTDWKDFSKQYQFIKRNND